MVIDRLVEWPATGRQTGPWLCAGVALVGFLAALWALLRSERPLSVAIRLDQTLRKNEDRWATSLDLAGRRTLGGDTDRPETVERLFRETEQRTSARDAISMVSLRGLSVSLVFVLLAALGVGTLCLSSFFSVPLLWQRFWHPFANLPRDSLTQVRIVEVVGSAAQPTAQPDPAFSIPENDAFTIRVEVSRRGQVLPAAGAPDASRPAALPSLEAPDDRGAVASAEFIRTGKSWTFTRPDVARDFRFRIRADDALTQFFTLRVEPRIRITSFRHSIRYPGYCKLPDVRQEPLERERLSVLEDSRLEFFVECDRPIKQIEAVFELLQDSSDVDPAATLSARELWQAGQTHEPRKREEPKEKRRLLSARIRKQVEASFQMKADHSGILRVRVVGDNGLPGLERACVIEPVKDTPPRITVSGLEPDTYIVPGELVGFQYSAEDDLAVSDIYLDWGTAGGARCCDLAGEEYLKNEHFGQRIVSGKETIQRMNYAIYGTEPFDLRLMVVDSKGQETRTSDFRIHLLTDTYATRFKSGMAFFDTLAQAANYYRGHLHELNNLLNIVEAAAGQGKTWPKQPETLTETLMKLVHWMESDLDRERARHFFSGWPQRLQESIALLLAVQRCLDRGTSYLRSGEQMLNTQDLPGMIAMLRKRIAGQMELTELWRAAIAGEARRFLPEALLQDVRNLRQRLARLDVMRPNRELYEANLTFYRAELAKVLIAAKGLDAPLGEAVKPLVEELEQAMERAEPRPLAERLRFLERGLSRHAPPLSLPAAQALAEAGRRAETDPDIRRRLFVAVAETLASRDAEALSAPFGDLLLCRQWLTEALPKEYPWHGQPASAIDLWLLSHRLLRGWELHVLDTEMRRYELNPDKADDVEAELREQALVLRAMLSRGAAIPPETAKRLEPVLDAASMGGLAEPAGLKALAEFRQVAGTLEAAGRNQLQEMRPELSRILQEMAGKMRRVAQDYEAYAVEFEADQKAYSPNDPWYRDKNEFLGRMRPLAFELQAGPKAMETAYRNSHYLRMLAELSPPSRGAWQEWQPWHGLQLISLFDGHDGFAKVTFRFNIHAKQSPETIPMHARAYAQQLRSHAEILERAVAGRPLEFDFQQLMKERRTLGYLDSLEKEFGVVTPFLGAGDEAARSESAQKVLQSEPGRIASNETLLAALQAFRVQLRKAQELPASELLRTLRSIERLLTRDGEQPEIEPLKELAAELEKLPDAAKAQPPAQALLPQVQVVLTKLGEDTAALFSAVQIPPINMIRQSNLRWQTPEDREFWPVRMVIEDYDRRWVYRMRDAQFALVRDLLAAAGPAAPAGNARRLAMSYARLVDLRARQTAQEQRKNQGISYLEEDSGPALKLPQHIAQEFLRARNRRPPEQFKEKSEAYFQRLYRDLSR
jgi:hypothetical protein